MYVCTWKILDHFSVHSLHRNDVWTRDRRVSKLTVLMRSRCWDFETVPQRLVAMLNVDKTRSISIKSTSNIFNLFISIAWHYPTVFLFFFLSLALRRGTETIAKTKQRTEHEVNIGKERGGKNCKSPRFWKQRVLVDPCKLRVARKRRGGSVVVISDAISR